MALRTYFADRITCETNGVLGLNAAWLFITDAAEQVATIGKQGARGRVAAGSARPRRGRDLEDRTWPWPRGGDRARTLGWSDFADTGRDARVGPGIRDITTGYLTDNVGLKQSLTYRIGIGRCQMECRPLPLAAARTTWSPSCPESSPA